MIKVTPNYIAIRINQLLAHTLKVRLLLGYDEATAKERTEFSKHIINHIDVVDKYTMRHLRRAKRIARMNILNAITYRPNAKASTKTYKDKEFAPLFNIATTDSLCEAQRLDTTQ